MDDDPEYLVKSTRLYLDKNTAMYTGIEIRYRALSIEDKEEMDRVAAIPAAEGCNSHGYYYDPTVLPEEIYNYWVSFCKEDLKDRNYADSSDSELLGYLIPIETEGDLSDRDHPGITEMRFVYKTDREEYLLYKVVSEVYHGQDEVNDGNWDWLVSEDGAIAYTEPNYVLKSCCDSLEELIDGYSDEYTYVPLEQ